MPCTKHCSICGKAFKGSFGEAMQKLRRHRKQKHPQAHRKSVRKGLKTKGILDPSKSWNYSLRCVNCGHIGGMHRFAGKGGCSVEGCDCGGGKYSRKKRAYYDPLKVRKGLIKKPKVEAYTDHKASGLIRILERQEGTLFPEFALYPKSDRKLLTESLKDAGLKQEARGKWVLRTNKFNIFVYI